jgi:isoleucyl-tRNA synthetase
LATYSAKPNFKTLGPKLGKQIKICAAAVAKLGTEEIAEVLAGKTLRVDLEGSPFEMSADDLLIARNPREGLAVASEGEIVVALETTLTPELEQEGLAREFVSKLQNLRKTEGLDVSDRIQVRFRGSEAVQAAVSEHRNFIMAEILSLAFEFDAATEGEAFDLNGEEAVVLLKKA